MIDSLWLVKEIWGNYEQHHDLEVLREGVLTSPWYVTPVSTECSLIEWAVDSRDAAAVRLLNSLGESVNLPAHLGFTLLHTAVDVLSNTVDPNERVKAVEVLETLLQLGANPNVQGVDGTSLHRAAGSGDIDAARLLVQYGADLGARTLVDGEVTPIEHAKLMNVASMVDYLIHQAPKDAAASGHFGNGP